MFGHDWETAQATVIAVKDLSNWSGDPNSTFRQTRPHEYVVDVRPPGGQPPFRATFRDPYLRGDREHPSEGQVINVLYHPKSQHVKLVASEWKFSTDGSSDAKREQDERFAAAEHGSPGDPGASGPQGSSADQLTELGARHERGELNDAEYQAQMEKVWDGELGLPHG